MIWIPLIGLPILALALVGTLVLSTTVEPDSEEAIESFNAGVTFARVVLTAMLIVVATSWMIHLASVIG